MCDSKCGLSQELKKCCENSKLIVSKKSVWNLIDDLATLRKTSKCTSTLKSKDESAVNFLKSFLFYYLDKVEIEEMNSDVDLFTLLYNFGAYAQDISTHILKNGDANETTKQDMLSLLKLYSQFSLMKNTENL
jgi:hypothetical protein